jgi:long-chain acyl-CoA synthetase
MSMIYSLTVGDVSRENARRFPLRTAVVCGDRRLTYRELDTRTNRLADALARDGVGPGERVLWLGQNSFRVLELLIACSKLGAILCPGNWRQAPGELAFVIDDCAARVVIAQHEEIGDGVAAARALASDGARWLFHDDDGPDGYEAFLASGGETDVERPVDSAAPALMIYTAAFQGRPNGALLGSASLIGSGLSVNYVESLTHDDVFLVSGPLFHIGCWRYVIGLFMLGGANVFVRRVEAEALCALIQAERCTHAYLFAATQQQMAEVAGRCGYDLSSIRWVSGDAAWNSLVSLSSNGWLERPQRYGQTEAGGIVARGAYGPGPEGLHGRTDPLAQLRIFGADGAEAPVGEPGEIVVRGPLVMAGYHNRPELNAAKMAGGWLRTGDLGRREADGSITFIGPMARMLKCGMENVYPAEVEQAMRGHPDVADCAVIGVPDPRFIQVVKAIIVPAAGCSPSAENLIAHARACLAGYKAPRSFAFVDALPRAAQGVDYAQLDAAHGGGGYPGGDARTSGQDL